MGTGAVDSLPVVNGIPIDRRNRFSILTLGAIRQQERQFLGSGSERPLVAVLRRSSGS